MKNMIKCGKMFGIGALMYIAASCEKDEFAQHSYGEKKKEILEQVLKNHYDWAGKSKEKDYEAMLDLTAPNSDFEEMTNECKKAWDFWDTCNYEFDYLKVFLNNSFSEATVTGNWKHYTSGNKILEGGFSSTAVLSENNKKWVLENIDTSRKDLWTEYE